MATSACRSLSGIDSSRMTNLWATVLIGSTRNRLGGRCASDGFPVEAIFSCCKALRPRPISARTIGRSVEALSKTVPGAGATPTPNPAVLHATLALGDGNNQELAGVSTSAARNSDTVLTITKLVDHHHHGSLTRSTPHSPEAGGEHDECGFAVSDLAHRRGRRDGSLRALHRLSGHNANRPSSHPGGRVAARRIPPERGERLPSKRASNFSARTADSFTRTTNSSTRTTRATSTGGPTAPFTHKHPAQGGIFPRESRGKRVASTSLDARVLYKIPSVGHLAADSECILYVGLCYGFSVSESSVT